MGLNIEALASAPAIKWEFREWPKITPADVKRLRKTLGLSQYGLSRLLHVSKKAVEKWEQGANRVKGCAEVLINLLLEEPSLASSLLIVEGVNQGVPEKLSIFAK